MSRFLLSSAFLARLLPRKDSTGESDVDADADAEKGDPNDSGGVPNAGNDDVEGRDHDTMVASDDEDGPGFTEAEEDHRPTQRRGVRLLPTSTISSTSTIYVRPSLPKWLLKPKDVLFGSPHSREESPEFIPNYRRAPIISGSLIPFSILLQIPGLTEHWYVRTEGNQTVASRKNSALLEAGLIISIILVVFANLALICRFMERRVKRCTILSILALTLHDILNIVIVIIFGTQHRFNDGFTYGEAYWTTICSTVLSIVTNILLIWDFVKTPNFGKSGSGITRRQRSLVIITMIFLTYVALGALMSSIMMSLTFLNGLFFTIVTTLTIGFGDIVPVTAAQRAAVCIYAVFGIVILGAAVRLTTEAVLEDIEVGYRRRLQEYKKRRHERKLERERVRRWRVAVEKRLEELGLDVWAHDKAPSPSTLYSRPNLRHQGTNFTLPGSTFMTQSMHLNTEALSTEMLESAAQEAGVPLEAFIGRKFRRRARSHHRHHHHHNQENHHHNQENQDQDDQQQSPLQKQAQRTRVPLDFTWTIDDGPANEPEKTRICGGTWWKRIRKALHLERSGEAKEKAQPEPEPGMDMTSLDMLKLAEREERRSLYTKLGFSWALFFTFWTIGSLIFSQTEGWTYGQSMYFCFIAFTTIGYGDFAPESALGRAIFVFWALFGVGTMTVLIAVISDAFSSKYRHVTRKTFDRAVHRYRHGQSKSTRHDAGEKRVVPGRPLSQIVPVLQANLIKVSSSSQPAPCSIPRAGMTLSEADECLRVRIEPLPTMILKEVVKFRESTRFFFIAGGHGDALSQLPDPQGASSPKQKSEVPEELKKLVDEIAQEEGFDERLKQEVWDDEHARNVVRRQTLFALSLEKGALRLIEAAEHALEMLAHRDQLAALEKEVQTAGVANAT